MAVSGRQLASQSLPELPNKAERIHQRTPFRGRTMTPAETLATHPRELAVRILASLDGHPRVFLTHAITRSKPVGTSHHATGSKASLRLRERITTSYSKSPAQ